MRLVNLEKKEQRFVLPLRRVSRISFSRPVSKVTCFHVCLHERVTASQLPVFLSLSLYSKRKIQYLKD